MNKTDMVTLQNKYNRSEARRKDLEEQLRSKTEQWKAAESEFKTAEFHTRRLCTEILARDTSEMVLGEAYSWDNISTTDMAIKALTSMRRYNEARTDLLRKLLDVSEDRRLQVEGLTEQVQMLRNMSSMMKEGPTEEPARESEPERPPAAPTASAPTGEPLAPIETKSAPPKVELIIEEDQDVQEVDLNDVREIVALTSGLQGASREIPVHPAKKILRERQKAAQEQSMAHMVDLTEYRSQMTDLMWVVMEIVGKEGVSEFTLIETRIGERQPDQVTKAKVRMTIQTLHSMGVLAQEQVSDPLRSKYYAYRLTEIGHRLYKDHFGAAPVLSELDVIIAQHDNANHGYGIRALAELLTESGRFASVSYDSRKNTIKLDRGGTYIPDIVAKAGGETYFYEYECGNHTQSDFDAKCNKMCRMTSCLDFVVPNREVLQKRLVPQVKAWIKNKGGRKALTGKTVRITTATALKDANPLENASWQVIFDMTSDDPIWNT